MRRRRSRTAAAVALKELRTTADALEDGGGRARGLRRRQRSRTTAALDGRFEDVVFLRSIFVARRTRLDT